ncbi:hypothetical protein ACFQ0M_10295 [Kitasatospora aburaviensis]
MLADALAVHGDRLVTVTGLGGVGKTRLVLEVARRLHLAARWSVRWIDCASSVAVGTQYHPEPARSGPTLIDLGRTEGGRTDLGRARDGRADLARAIGDRPTLLVLDGADGRVDTALLDELFQRCPGLRVLITARVAQPLPGGQVIPLAPLPTPGPNSTTTRPRWPRWAPSGCCSHTCAGCVRATGWSATRRRRSLHSAANWTACPGPWSSRPAGRRCCRRGSWWPGCRTGRST